MSPSSETVSNVARPLLLLAMLFFMWGFLTSMNDILIPYLKGVFELSFLQAMLVQFCFFGAYFIGSALYFFISSRWSDPMQYLGYQRGAVLGLLISAVGAALFWPASVFESYGFFLAALFVLGLGFTLLQIAANPYVTVLGREETASSRLNLCQGFNSLGTTLGPLIGGQLILQSVVGSGVGGADLVRGPYIVFAAMLLGLAIFMALVKLPRITATESSSSQGFRLRDYPHLMRGGLAIFFYVGAEVAIGSILINFLALDNIAGMTEERASAFVAIYWGGLMIGRFLGSVLLTRISFALKAVAMVAIPCIGFFFLAFATAKGRGLDYSATLSLLMPYSIFIVLNLVAFVVGASKAGRTTGVFALAVAVLAFAPLVTDGAVAMWCVIGIGLFNSIMWSNIFSLSIEGLGNNKSHGSSVLVMAIVGGALIPVVQGGIADKVGIANSFIVPVLAYLYLTYYGFRGHSASPKLARQEMVVEAGS